MVLGRRESPDILVRWRREGLRDAYFDAGRRLRMIAGVRGRHPLGSISVERVATTSWRDPQHARQAIAADRAWSTMSEILGTESAPVIRIVVLGEPIEVEATITLALHTGHWTIAEARRFSARRVQNALANLALAGWGIEEEAIIARLRKGERP